MSVQEKSKEEIFFTVAADNINVLKTGSSGQGCINIGSLATSNL